MKAPAKFPNKSFIQSKSEAFQLTKTQGLAEM